MPPAAASAGGPGDVALSVSLRPFGAGLLASILAFWQFWRADKVSTLPMTSAVPKWLLLSAMSCLCGCCAFGDGVLPKLTDDALACPLPDLAIVTSGALTALALPTLLES